MNLKIVDEVFIIVRSVLILNFYWCVGLRERFFAGEKYIKVVIIFSKANERFPSSSSRKCSLFL